MDPWGGGGGGGRGGGGGGGAGGNGNKRALMKVPSGDDEGAIADAVRGDERVRRSGRGGRAIVLNASGSPEGRPRSVRDEITRIQYKTYDTSRTTASLPRACT